MNNDLFIADIRKIKEDRLPPEKVFDLQIQAIIKDFARSVMASGECCPACGRKPAKRRTKRK